VGGGRGGRGGGAGEAGEAAARRCRGTCGPNVTGMTGVPPPSMSPDGKKAIFVCDWNLWMQGRRDGAGAAADDRRREGLRLRDEQRRMDDERGRRRCRGRPDGKKIATQQQDERKVGDMYLVETPVNGGHPVLRRGSIRCPAIPTSR
jgi:hypothetical protein